MCAGPAQIEPGNRHAVVGMAQHGAGAEQLIEGHLPVEDVAVDEAEAALQVERGEHLAGNHARLEIGRMGGDGVDHEVGKFLPGIVTAPVAEQTRRGVLHEQAGDMPARRRQRLIER